jgi:hypothetical protein
VAVAQDDFELKEANGGSIAQRQAKMLARPEGEEV